MLGKRNGMYGKSHSENVKQAQSEMMKGKIPVIDNNGERFLISKGDKRWLNEEVMSLTKLRQYKDFHLGEDVYQCPNCGVKGKGNDFLRNHFKDCRNNKE